MTDQDEAGQTSIDDAAASDQPQVSEQAVAAVTEAAERQSRVQPVKFGTFGRAAAHGEQRRNLDLLLDVEIPVSVEVGRAQMSLNDILRLVPGSIVRLDKKIEDPIDLRVNGKLVARGEVVMVDDCYGLRVTQVVEPAARLESLR
jgi:flagellar motor switch protein FliN/FliY